MNILYFYPKRLPLSVLLKDKPGSLGWNLIPWPTVSHADAYPTELPGLIASCIWLRSYRCRNLKLQASWQHFVKDTDTNEWNSFIYFLSSSFTEQDKHVKMMSLLQLKLELISSALSWIEIRIARLTYGFLLSSSCSRESIVKERNRSFHLPRRFLPRGARCRLV